VNWAVIIAAVDIAATPPVTKHVAADMVKIVGLAVLAFGGIAAWIYFVRGAKKHPDEDHQPNLSSSVTITEDGRERKRKKRRERRRDHRQRNPTLAETGGLPPERGSQPGPSI